MSDESSMHNIGRQERGSRSVRAAGSHAADFATSEGAIEVSDPPEAADAGPSVAGGSVPSIAGALLRSTRPQQWIKNALVFAGVVFSQQLTDAVALRYSVLTFGLFVLASGGIYLVNDILDRDADRVHPLKRQRPLAAGTLPLGAAIAAAAVLLSGALIGALLMQPALGGILALYVGMNLAYSARLKHVVLLDVLLVASGFLLRAAAGAVAVLTPISPWLYLCTLLAALLVILGKRRSELALLGPRAATHRRNLAHYATASLDRWLTGLAATTVAAYVLYALFSPATFGNPKLLATVPFVAFGLLRYLRIVRASGGAESPEALLFRDPWLLGSVVLWGAAVLVLLYFV